MVGRLEERRGLGFDGLGEGRECGDGRGDRCVEVAGEVEGLDVVRGVQEDRGGATFGQPADDQFDEYMMPFTASAGKAFAS